MFILWKQYGCQKLISSNSFYQCILLFCTLHLKITPEMFSWRFIWFVWVLIAFPVIAPRYIPWLWCVCLHYQAVIQRRFHTCCSHQEARQYQTRFWSCKWRSHYCCYQGYQFLLCKPNVLHSQHWILLCYSRSARRLVDQSSISTWNEAVTWRGIAHQRLVSAESWPACWWQ